MNTSKNVLIATSLTLAGVMFYLWGHFDGREGRALIEESLAAEEMTEVSPTLARERDTYYPNSEDLKPDEMRVIACGTGMPTTSRCAGCCLLPGGTGQR